MLPRLVAPVLALVVAGLAAGCTAEPAPVDGDGAAPNPAATTVASRRPPPPTPDIEAVYNAAVFGKWRRQPAHATETVMDTAEQACRAEDGVGDLPQVVFDARGEGEVTIVFADADAAVVCRATLTDPDTATAVARPVVGYPGDKAPGPGKLGIHDLEVVTNDTGSRGVLVGRVGTDVHDVAAAFDDWTWGTASMEGGWYAMWWPGFLPALTVAASNSRSVVIDDYTP